MSEKNQIVTIAEQERMGIRRPAQSGNYVRAHSNPVQVLPPASLSDVRHTLDIAPTATQHVEMRTSATDRAKGYLIASLPMYAAFAFGALLVAVVGWDVPIVSISALVIFWLTFVVSWLVGWVYTLSISAEGVSMFEAKSKWDVIKREQANRWEYYNRLNGHSKDGDK